MNCKSKFISEKESQVLKEFENLGYTVVAIDDGAYVITVDIKHVFRTSHISYLEEELGAKLEDIAVKSGKMRLAFVYA